MPTTITVPAGAKWAIPLSADFGLRQNALVSTSMDGTVQRFELPGARWVMTLNFNNQTWDDRAKLEALFASMRGQINPMSMGHPMRRIPRGTMRGSPTLNGSHAQFATTLNITGTGTLLAGDMLGVNGQLVMVTANTDISAAVVPITPYLRAAQTNGTAITWDWPRALWIPTDAEVRLPLGPGSRICGPFSVSLTEVFA